MEAGGDFEEARQHCEKNLQSFSAFVIIVFKYLCKKVEMRRKKIQFTHPTTWCFFEKSKRNY